LGVQAEFARLLAMLLRPKDSKVTFMVFESSCTCYYRSNHSKAEAVSLSALPNETTSELVDLSSQTIGATGWSDPSG